MNKFENTFGRWFQRALSPFRPRDEKKRGNAFVKPSTGLILLSSTPFHSSERKISA